MSRKLKRSFHILILACGMWVFKSSFLYTLILSQHLKNICPSHNFYLFKILFAKFKKNVATRSLNLA